MHKHCKEIKYRTGYLTHFVASQMVGLLQLTTSIVLCICGSLSRVCTSRTAVPNAGKRQTWDQECSTSAPVPAQNKALVITHTVFKGRQSPADAFFPALLLN